MTRKSRNPSFQSTVLSPASECTKRARLDSATRMPPRACHPAGLRRCGLSKREISTWQGMHAHASAGAGWAGSHRSQGRGRTNVDDGPRPRPLQVFPEQGEQQGLDAVHLGHDQDLGSGFWFVYWQTLVAYPLVWSAYGCRVALALAGGKAGAQAGRGGARTLPNRTASSSVVGNRRSCSCATSGAAPSAASCALSHSAACESRRAGGACGGKGAFACVHRIQVRMSAGVARQVVARAHRQHLAQLHTRLLCSHPRGRIHDERRPRRRQHRRAVVQAERLSGQPARLPGRAV